jgi:hypothetical protein
MTNKQDAVAMRLYTQWRAEGVPTLITLHEAFVLTDGKVGTEGAASNNSITLSAVAQRAALRGA